MNESNNNQFYTVVDDEKGNPKITGKIILNDIDSNQGTEDQLQFSIIIKNINVFLNLAYARQDIANIKKLTRIKGFLSNLPSSCNGLDLYSLKDKLYDDDIYSEIVPEIESLINEEIDKPGEKLRWAQGELTRIEKTRDKQSEKVKNSSDNKTIEKIKERLLLTEIDKYSKGSINIDLPSSYSPKRNYGFQCISSKDFTNLNGSSGLFDFVYENECEEIISLVALERTKYITKEIKPASKGGLFGIGKRNAEIEKKPIGEEPILCSEWRVGSEKSGEDLFILSYLVTGREYISIDGRGGQMILMQLALPKSIATECKKRLKDNPKFIREIAKRRLKKYFEENDINMNFEKVWDHGDKKTNEHRLKPHYEAIDKKPFSWEEISSAECREKQLYVNKGSFVIANRKKDIQ